MQCSFRFPNNRIVKFDLPNTSSKAPSSYLIGIKKGGSTLLANVMRDLEPFSEKAIFEFSKLSFSGGLAPSAAVEDIDRALLQPGYVYGVFRWLPENDLLKLARLETENIKRPVKVLTLIRDPRDVMVSLYFSDAKSHAIRKDAAAAEIQIKRQKEVQQIGLDEYVLQKTSMILRHYLRTTQVLALKNSRILRYEDIIYDKPALVSAVADAMMADADAQTMAKIAKKNDKMPSEEKEDRHVRQVHPGNYKKRLKPETIEQLNESFKVILNSFNYDV